MIAALELPEKARELFTEDTLPEELGWIAWLTPRHMRLFAVELSAALASPSPAKLATLFESWQATAEMDHSPETQAKVERNRAKRFVSVDKWLNTKQSRTA